jgi:hypothetical protein
MAAGRSLHQHGNGEGDVVSLGAVKRLPLLPYEKQLIEALGCSEEDYQKFVNEALYRSQVRPAAYNNIPDIRNEPATLTAVLINLAVGVALSAVSYLLTPKPKAPSEVGQVRQRQLRSRRGGDRFLATSGFDSIADLATYGDPIPVIFGKYTGATGGMLVAPRLVWSRAFSLGSQQSVKLLLVVGEQGLGGGITAPDLNGIFLGNTPLDAIYSHNFAFYWKRNSNTVFRVKAQNLLFGTRAKPDAGDIQTDDDIYLCPTRSSASDTGFCQAYTPSSSTQFGVYSGIANATNYRVNWRVVAIPRLENNGQLNAIDSSDNDPGRALLLERIKIAGDYGIEPTTDAAGDPRWVQIIKEGQKGVGRNYGRRMGITSVNRVPANARTEVRQVSVGDEAVFTIRPGKINRERYWFKDTKNTQVDDINSEILDGQEAADDALQKGETFMIGRTTWVVTDRAIPIYDGTAAQEIKLRCVEIFGGGADSASIGLVNDEMIDRGIRNDDNGETDARNGLGLSAGANFYPLLRVALGVVRNTRACDVTEIGIRSQVWQKANGLCNFGSLPSPADLKEAERNRVSIQSGTMNIYMRRTTAFSVFLRPAGTDAQGNEYAWVPLGQTFCISGQTPQDQFNYLRLTHPEQRQFEYRFIPNSGADIARRFPDDFRVLVLDAKNGDPIGGVYSTAYGTFSLNTTGRYSLAKSIKFNRQMATAARVTEERLGATIPSAIEIDSFIPDIEDATVTATAVSFFDWLPDSASVGRAGATYYEMFGQASQYGLVRTYTRNVNLGDGRTITLEFTGVVNETYPATHPYFPGFRAWSFQSIRVIESSGGFNTSQVFNVQIPVTPGNPRAQPYGLTVCGVRLQVNATSANLAPKGRESGWEYEILGNQESYALGSTNTQTISGTSAAGNAVQIQVTGTIVTRPADNQKVFPGQTKAWDNVTYTVVPSGTSGTWSKGELVDITRTVSAGNPFRKTGTTVGVRLRTLGVQTINIPAEITAERFFEENSQVADISIYNSLLSKSNESGPEHEIVYVNESITNPSTPNYNKMTLAGLTLKASRNFTSIDQIRCWLSNGIEVQRFLPSEASTIGPSNKFTDLVYYLLTDKTAGAGGVISSDLIETADLARTATFLEQNKLFFDGALDSPVNLRQFIADTAPYFLCSFVISNGKFSLVPAVPSSPAGSIVNTPIQIAALFTSGNIIEGSFSVDYLQTEERKDFQAIVRYRKEKKNQLPEEATLSVRWAENGSDTHPIESFDLTQFCTSRDHAFIVARYFMSLRRRVTHSVRFKTTPYGISLAPGDYIRVLTEASPYQPANNGVIDADGDITSVTTLSDGNYNILYYTSSNEEVKTAQLTVASGKAVQPTLFNTIFTLDNPTVSSSTYVIEQLTLDEDGLVDVLATEFPTNSTYNSLIAQDILSPGSFITEG